MGGVERWIGELKLPAPADEAKSRDEIGKWNLYVDLANELEIIFLPALNDYFETFGNGPEYRSKLGTRLIVNYSVDGNL